MKQKPVITLQKQDMTKIMSELNTMGNPGRVARSMMYNKTHLEAICAILSVISGNFMYWKNILQKASKEAGGDIK